MTVKQTAPPDATKDETYTYDPLNNLKTRAIGTPVTATTVNVHDAANQLLKAAAEPLRVPCWRAMSTMPTAV